MKNLEKKEKEEEIITMKKSNKSKKLVKVRSFSRYLKIIYGATMFLGSAVGLFLLLKYRNKFMPN